MSRTFNTDPPLIRAYRDEGRPPDPDWRERWTWSHARVTYDLIWRDYDAWQAERPRPRPYSRSWRRAWANTGSSFGDRRVTHSRYRAYVRGMIAHERYDEILPPRALNGWEDWDW